MCRLILPLPDKYFTIMTTGDGVRPTSTTNNCDDMAACAVPNCPDDQWAKPVPGKCCEFKCEEKGNPSCSELNV